MNILYFLTLFLFVLFLYFLTRPRFIYLVEKADIDRSLCNILAIAIFDTWMLGKKNYSKSSWRDIPKALKFPVFLKLRKHEVVNVASVEPEKIIIISKIRIAEKV